MNETSNVIRSLNTIDGKYLVDNVHFPQDTLRLKKFRLSDSTKTEKLMIELRNDSIFLSNYNFNGWYGKWFCNFHNGSATFENDKLYIEAQLINNYRCLNEEAWQKIEYRLTSVSDDTLTFIKTMDTTNCRLKTSVREHLGRGGKSDIEIR